MFTLTIDLGNEAMQTADDVSRALRKVAARLEGREWEEWEEGIMDDNGNNVGNWSFSGATVPGDETKED